MFPRKLRGRSFADWSPLRRMAYDSLYVAVAANLNATLVTVDEKPANALAGSFPVKWLSAI